MLAGKTILLGVSGGIAAYKSVELVRLLKKEGADVYVIMTEHATKFVTPLTFESLSGNPVFTDVVGEYKKYPVEHIVLSEKADLMVVAPATANIIAKFANGIADDYLSTTNLALTCPRLICPAMNHNMYAHPATQANLKRLESYDNYQLMEPKEGRLATGIVGKGRMPEAIEIFNEIKYLLSPKDMLGKTVLITAGPTREHYDPIRFLSNPSTGKMGYAIARKAAERGARVILVSGPVSIELPPKVKVVSVNTAIEMREAAIKYFDEADIFIGTAAVADYRPKNRATEKIKKGADTLILDLEKNPDIIAELGQNKDQRIVVGFAAETNNGFSYALEKIKKKNLDFIVLNDVAQKGAGFGVDTNIVKFVFPDGTHEEFPLMLKEDVATKILDQIMKL